MKAKNLLPRIPSKTLLQIWWRNWKFSRQANIKRIQHHQNSFTANAKGTSLGRKHSRRKRRKENKPKKIKKTVIVPWNVKVKLLSRIRLFATPWSGAYQVPPSMGFSRQGYWSGVPFPSPNSIIHIDNYLECRWVKCTNQKSQTGWVDENMCTYAFPLTTSLCLTSFNYCFFHPLYQSFSLA